MSQPDDLYDSVMAQPPELFQRWVDDGLERSEVLSDPGWPDHFVVEQVPVPFIGPVWPTLCETCGESIWQTKLWYGMDLLVFWVHLFPLPVELGHTAVPEPF
jgi:hypothetical protein